MIVKTAREIIRNAKTLANADNSAFTNFFLETNLLNNAYRDLYDILISETELYTSTIEVQGNTILPADCYSIIAVTDKAGNFIQQATIGTNVDGWRVVDNVFTTNNKNTVYKIVYATLPSTITAPQEAEQITATLSLNESALSTLVRKSNGTFILTHITSGVLYCGKSFTYSNNKIIWDGEDITDYVLSQGPYENNSIYNLKVFNNYMAVTFTDGTNRVVVIFNGLQATRWNYFDMYGYTPSKITVEALTTDDTTGFGMVVQILNPTTNNTENYYTSFVPDTILSYPTNTLFTLLEYKVAYMIAGLLNMNTDFIKEQMEKAETNFYKNLGGVPTNRRIKSSHRAKGIVLR